MESLDWAQFGVVAEDNELEETMKKMKEMFIDKGLPVLIGEMYFAFFDRHDRMKIVNHVELKAILEAAKKK